ncbi:MAG: flagellum-specific ATP synthase FliI, partial [Desulfobacteraceae bacterium]|nr:flagellum-specific ATP synthase FliI [Desulfobacteraceae bacterium]
MEGKIVKVAGIVAQANGPGMSIGSLCCIKNSSGQNMQAEVIGFNDKKVIVMPFGEMRGIEPGSRIVDIDKSPAIKVGEAYLSRVVDGLGNPIDGKGTIQAKADYPIY